MESRGVESNPRARRAHESPSARPRTRLRARPSPCPSVVILSDRRLGGGRLIEPPDAGAKQRGTFIAHRILAVQPRRLASRVSRTPPPLHAPRPRRGLDQRARNLRRDIRPRRRRRDRERSSRCDGILFRPRRHSRRAPAGWQQQPADRGQAEGEGQPSDHDAQAGCALRHEDETKRLCSGAHAARRTGPLDSRRTRHI